MSLGNGIGADLFGDIDDFTDKAYGDIIFEGDGLGFELIGKTGGDCISLNNEKISINALKSVYETALSEVYQIYSKHDGKAPESLFKSKNVYVY